MSKGQDEEEGDFIAQTPGVKAMIRDWAESKQDSWHDPLPGVYHAHTAWQCHRKNWYKRRGYPQEGDLPHGLFEMGHKAEDVAEAGLRHHFGWGFVFNNLPCREEFEVKIGGETYRGELRGKTDPAVYGYNMVPKILYEVKSKPGYRKDGPVIVNTEEHQKMQGSWYASRLGFPELRITHPGRQDALQMPDDDKVIGPDEIARRAAMTREYFRRQFIMDFRRVPPPGRPFLKWECGLCPFPSACEADGGPGVPADEDSYLKTASIGSITAADGGGKDAWAYEEEE